MIKRYFLNVVRYVSIFFTYSCWKTTSSTPSNFAKTGIILFKESGSTNISFSVTLKEMFVEPDSLNKIIPVFAKLDGVDEVVFQQEYVKKMLTYLTTFKKYLFIITSILFLISVYIVYSTVKLVTGMKMEEMETIKLVGAKLSTIKIPIILNGIFIGFIASLISIIIFFLYITYIDKYINLLKIFNLRNEYYIIGVLLLGPFIGFIVSIFTLKKVRLKIKY